MMLLILVYLGLGALLTWWLFRADRHSWILDAPAVRAATFIFLGAIWPITLAWFAGIVGTDLLKRRVHS